MENRGGIIVSYFLNSIDKENNFVEISRDKYFVDKSKLITKFNTLIRTSGKFVCITRPRRFGKASMLLCLHLIIRRI